VTIFDRVQIAFLLVTVLLAVWNTLRLRKQGVSVWVLGQGRKRGSERAVEGLYLLGLLLWFGLILLFATGHGGLLPRFLSAPFFDAPALKVLALVFLAFSFALHFLGLYFLGQSWRVGTREAGAGALVTRGVYRHTRNPVMVCLVLYAAAVWLTWSNLLMLLVLLLSAAAVHHQVRKEEAFLESVHGERYRAYRRRVARYVPLPRSGRGPAGKGRA